MDAVTYVRNQIEAARRTSADRLPSIAAMAKASGLPLRQIHRAVIRLRGAERLQVRRGSGIVLRPRQPAPSPPPAPSSRRTATDEAAAALVRRLRRGAFSHTGPFPSLKELSHELGVHRGTLRKVMRRLGDEGWVRREGRRWFMVHQHRDLSSANRIVFLGRDFHQGIAQAVFPGAARMMSALDQECARRGIRL
ncbi:MAG: GntR family transcriptional regulator [Chitinivibrionales bacterium]|nr:GntR family transcriptional regulator [Chitinivibrionales bacterium]